MWPLGLLLGVLFGQIWSHWAVLLAKIGPHDKVCRVAIWQLLSHSGRPLTKNSGRTGTSQRFVRWPSTSFQPLDALELQRDFGERESQCDLIGRFVAAWDSLLPYFLAELGNSSITRAFLLVYVRRFSKVSRGLESVNSWAISDLNWATFRSKYPIALENSPFDSRKRLDFWVSHSINYFLSFLLASRRFRPDIFEFFRKIIPSCLSPP